MLNNILINKIFLKQYCTLVENLHLYCVRWFAKQHHSSGAILHHSPNENPKGVQKTLIRYNAKMKNLGRKAGFPDIIILYKGKTLFIELKSQTGVLSKVQKLLFKDFQNTGFDVKIVRSLQEFQLIVNQFISCF